MAEFEDRIARQVSHAVGDNPRQVLHAPLHAASRAAVSASRDRPASSTSTSASASCRRFRIRPASGAWNVLRRSGGERCSGV